MADAGGGVDGKGLQVPGERERSADVDGPASLAVGRSEIFWGYEQANSHLF